MMRFRKNKMAVVKDLEVGDILIDQINFDEKHLTRSGDYLIYAAQMIQCFAYWNFQGYKNGHVQMVVGFERSAPLVIDMNQSGLDYCFLKQDCAPQKTIEISVLRCEDRTMAVLAAKKAHQIYLQSTGEEDLQLKKAVMTIGCDIASNLIFQVTVLICLFSKTCDLIEGEDLALDFNFHLLCVAFILKVVLSIFGRDAAIKLEVYDSEQLNLHKSDFTALCTSFVISCFRSASPGLSSSPRLFSTPAAMERLLLASGKFKAIGNIEATHKRYP